MSRQSKLRLQSYTTQLIGVGDETSLHAAAALFEQCHHFMCALLDPKRTGHAVIE